MHNQLWDFFQFSSSSSSSCFSLTPLPDSHLYGIPENSIQTEKWREWISESPVFQPQEILVCPSIPVAERQFLNVSVLDELE